mmetsp:Transcript_47827/g.89610  ORF Transcript_47827/g.89610 Transcript_47827/m.89610 type:complete len:238 (-) Transcript_47827:280-993(-)
MPPGRMTKRSTQANKTFLTALTGSPSTPSCIFARTRSLPQTQRGAANVRSGTLPGTMIGRSIQVNKSILIRCTTSLNIHSCISGSPSQTRSQSNTGGEQNRNGGVQEVTLQRRRQLLQEALLHVELRQHHFCPEELLQVCRLQNLIQEALLRIALHQHQLCPEELLQAQVCLVLALKSLSSRELPTACMRSFRREANQTKICKAKDDSSIRLQLHAWKQHCRCHCIRAAGERTRGGV